MFNSMTARVSINTYCLARTGRFSRRSENSVERVTYEREVSTDTVQLVIFYELRMRVRRAFLESESLELSICQKPIEQIPDL